MINMVLSVPRPMQSPGLTGRRKPKSLLHERSAKVFAVSGVRVTAMASTLVHGRFEDARITCRRQLNSDPTLFSQFLVINDIQMTF